MDSIRYERMRAGGDVWYQEVTSTTCKTCRGSGQVQTGHDSGDDERDYCECFDCFAKGYHEHYGRLLSLDEYQAMCRQEAWLKKRYGYVKTSIADYWRG